MQQAGDHEKEESGAGADRKTCRYFGDNVQNVVQNETTSLMLSVIKPWITLCWQRRKQEYAAAGSQPGVQDHNCLHEKWLLA